MFFGGLKSTYTNSNALGSCSYPFGQNVSKLDSPLLLLSLISAGNTDPLRTYIATLFVAVFILPNSLPGRCEPCQH